MTCGVHKTSVKGLDKASVNSYFAELRSPGPYQAHRFELWQSIRSFLEAIDDEC